MAKVTKGLSAYKVCPKCGRLPSVTHRDGVTVMKCCGKWVEVMAKAIEQETRVYVNDVGWEVYYQEDPDAGTIDITGLYLWGNPIDLGEAVSDDTLMDIETAIMEKISH